MTTPPFSKIGSVYVPHSGPVESAKIIFIGESPGAEEVKQRQPFVGASGGLLRDSIRRCGIDPEQQVFTNLCHYRPDENRFEHLIGSEVIPTYHPAYVYRNRARR